MNDIDRIDTYNDEQVDENLAAMAVRVLKINEGPIKRITISPMIKSTFTPVNKPEDSSND